MFRLNSNFKEFSFYIFTQFLLIITPIIYIPLTSSFLKPEEFGKASMFLMCLSFSSQLFYGPVSNGVNKYYYLAFESGKLNSFFVSIERIILGLSGINLVIILIIYKFFSILKVYSFLELILIYISITLFGIYVIFNGLLGVQRNRSKQMFLEICVNFSKVLSLYIIFRFFLISNISVLFSSIFSLLIALVLLKHLLKYKSLNNKRSPFSKHFYKRIVHFAIPFSLWAPFLSGYFISDRLLIQHYYSLKELGNYSIQYQLTFSSMQLCTSFISGFILPILLKENLSHSSSKNQYSILIYLSFIIIIIGSVGGFFLYRYGEFLIHLFVKKDYAISPIYLFFMTLSGTLYGASQILAIKQTLNNQNNKVLYFNIILSVLGIYLNYCFLQFYGIQGLVYSLLILSLLWYISFYLLFKLE